MVDFNPATVGGLLDGQLRTQVLRGREAVPEEGGTIPVRCELRLQHGLVFASVHDLGEVIFKVHTPLERKPDGTVEAESESVGKFALLLEPTGFVQRLGGEIRAFEVPEDE